MPTTRTPIARRQERTPITAAAINFFDRMRKLERACTCPPVCEVCAEWHRITDRELPIELRQGLFDRLRRRGNQDRLCTCPPKCEACVKWRKLDGELRMELRLKPYEWPVYAETDGGCDGGARERYEALVQASLAAKRAN
jgi:hypothetical protein